MDTSINPIDARVNYGVLTQLGMRYQMQWHPVEYDIDRTTNRVLQHPNLPKLIGERLYSLK
jgi:hypothetical protein